MLKLRILHNLPRAGRMTGISFSRTPRSRKMRVSGKCPVSQLFLLRDPRRHHPPVFLILSSREPRQSLWTSWPTLSFGSIIWIQFSPRIAFWRQLKTDGRTRAYRKIWSRNFCGLWMPISQKPIRTLFLIWTRRTFSQNWQIFWANASRYCLVIIWIRWILKMLIPACLPPCILKRRKKRILMGREEKVGAASRSLLRNWNMRITADIGWLWAGTRRGSQWYPAMDSISGPSQTWNRIWRVETIISNAPLDHVRLLSKLDTEFSQDIPAEPHI